MNCKAARIADIGDVIVKLQGIDELAAGFLASGKLEADKTAKSACQIGRPAGDGFPAAREDNNPLRPPFAS